jgi:transcriptional regulator with XRE-family HTH domain
MTGDPLKLFGRHLTWLRKQQRGWSQEALSLESGLARSYLSGIERGTRNVALYNICTLADTLGVAPSVMLDFSSHCADAPVEPARAPFNPEISPAVQATLRYMTELSDTDRDVVAGVARALARKQLRKIA